MKNNQRELRQFDVRQTGAADGPSKIVGLAVPYNTISRGEMFQPSAFAKTLQEQRDIKAYWGHDWNQVLGRTGNGTLMLSEQDDGLHFEITPNPDTNVGRDALALVARGDVNQMSFGFRPVKESVEEIGGAKVRVIHEARLYEISPVAEPWYPSTTAEARDAQDDVETSAEPEPGQDAHSTLAAKRRRLRLAETN